MYQEPTDVVPDDYLLGAVCIPESTFVEVECTTTGTPVSGPAGVTDVWDKVTWSGLVGYVSGADLQISGPVADAPPC